MALENGEIGTLAHKLHANPEMPLVFALDEQTINPGYHLTEVRHARVSSIDCGKNSEPEHWDEISIQLLDGSSGSNQGHMTTGKLIGIIEKALTKLDVDSESSSSLFIEFAPDNGPIRKLNINSYVEGDNELIVNLGSEKAVCKPFQRSKLAQAAAELTGGAIGPAQVSGCCSTDSKGGSGCC